ncbi:unnamed protein product, partial [marine sediment metagenome]
NCKFGFTRQRAHQLMKWNEDIGRFRNRLLEDKAKAPPADEEVRPPIDADFTVVAVDDSVPVPNERQNLELSRLDDKEAEAVWSDLYQISKPQAPTLAQVRDAVEERVEEDLVKSGTITDSLGTEVTDEDLARAFAKVEDVRNLVNEMNRIRKALRSLAKHPVGKRFDAAKIDELWQAARWYIKDHIPHVLADGGGFLTKPEYDKLMGEHA